MTGLGRKFESLFDFSYTTIPRSFLAIQFQFREAPC